MTYNFHRFYSVKNSQVVEASIHTYVRSFTVIISLQLGGSGQYPNQIPNLAKKIPSIGDRLLLYDLLFIDSQPLQVIFNTFSYSLEREDKALWLKMSPTGLKEHGKKSS